MSTTEKKELDKVIVTVTVPHEITRRRLQSLLSTWFESPQGSWFHRVEGHTLQAGMILADFKEGGRFTDPDDYYPTNQIIPFTDGCKLTLKVDDPESNDDGTMEVEIGLFEIINGIKLMAVKSPRHFKDFLEENDDANTADLFGQYVVYMEEVYC